MKRDLAYVVHSDRVIADRVSEALRQSDFEVSAMTTLEDAEFVIRERQFDLPDAILSWATPAGKEVEQRRPIHAIGARLFLIQVPPMPFPCWSSARWGGLFHPARPNLSLPPA